MIGLLEIIWVSATLLALLTWCALVLVVPLALRLRTAFRSTVVGRAWLYAPLWVPALLVSAAMLPGVVGAVGAFDDHCLAHADAHGHHLCVLHPPHAADVFLTWVLPLVLLLPALFLTVSSLRHVLLEWRLGRNLVLLSRPSELGDDVRLLDQRDPVALTVGFKRTTILLTDGLVKRLSASALAVVLAHERAHAARGDTRLALFDRIAASFLPRRVAAPLLERIRLGCELACDAQAARSVGGPLVVARALTEVARLGLRPPSFGVSVASGAFEARVLALLRTPARWNHAPLMLAALMLAVGLAGAGPVHNLVERFVTHLIHP